MKNRRMILWLLVALAVTIGAHVLLSYKGGVGAALVARKTLLDVSRDAPTQLVVARAHEKPARLTQTGEWQLVEPYAARVDDRTVLKLLDALASSEIDETIGDSELMKLARTRADFGLDDDALKVTVASEDATSTVRFGRVTPTGDGVYAAIDGEDAVYVVSSNVLAAVDLPPEGFRQRAIFPAWAGAVVAFDLKRGAGSFMRFLRDGESWVMKEPETAGASAPKIKKLLGDIAQAEAVEFVWPVGAEGESTVASVSLLAGYGLDPESAVTLTFKCADGADRQLSFGKTAKDGLVYALVQNAGAIVTVDGSLKDQALAGVTSFTDRRLFPFEVSSVSRISVTDGETNYLLAKDDDGTWRLDAPVAAPTDTASVTALLERLSALTPLDVAAEGLSVSVMSAPPQTVSRAAVLNGLRLEDLRSREVVRIDPLQVKRLVVTRAHGEAPTSVVYDKDRRAWNVEKSARGGAADAAAVESVTAALNPLLAERVVKLKVSADDLKRYGLDEPRLTMAIDQDREDAVRRNILIGAETEDGFYATRGATDAVFVLSAETVKRLTVPLTAL